MTVYALLTESKESQLGVKVATSSFLNLAGMTQSGFYLYHDRVLQELGFEKLGSCLHRKHAVRWIYLSQSGNLLVELVEVGLGAGKNFFTLKTVTNDGKFLETNSMVKAKHEKRDVNMRLQLRSANHEDIIRALAEHDRLVTDFTYGGSVQEAQFTEERFERFLRWGAVSV